jgi:hypothetical protein
MKKTRISSVKVEMLAEAMYTVACKDSASCHAGRASKIVEGNP